MARKKAMRMSWFKGKRLTHRSGSPTRGVCDSCNAQMEQTEGYYLVTERVVTSKLYWRSLFARTIALHDISSMTEAQQVGTFTQLLRHVAGQRSLWRICENCSEFFTFDRAEARSYANLAAETMQIDPAECALWAAAAWEQVYGRWPSNVEQPAVGYSCDICATKIYVGENAGSLPRARMERMRANGLFEDAPVTIPRPDTDSWIVCTSCMAPQLARWHRTEHRPK
jgi:hypothetical protein